MNKILVAGTMLAFVTVVFFVTIVASNPFPTFRPNGQTQRFVNTNSNVGVEDSEFMWTNFDTALAGQAFVIFAAAAGCLAILRIEERRKTE